MKPLSTGLPKLDKLLKGGIPHSTVVLLSGSAGTGKTLLALNFLLDGAEKGERCVYLSLGESREELLRACSSIRALQKAERYVDKNLLIIEANMGEGITLAHFTNIFASYKRVDRLVIDNVNRLLLFAKDGKEYRQKLYLLARLLRKKAGCALVLSETKKDEVDTGNGEAFECDGVLHIAFSELEEKPKRTLTIHKMRYAEFEPKVPYELVISSVGIKLTDTRII